MKGTYNFHGFLGKGENKRAAQADALEQAGNFLEQNFTPILLSWRGNSLIIWTTPQGYCSSLLLDGTSPVACATMYGADRSLTEVVDGCKYHLVQVGWVPGESAECEFLPESYKAEFASWVRFQNAYRQRRADGATDQEARDYAWERYAA